MKPPSDLEALLEELRGLNDRELRSTLSGLSPGEQAEVLELLESRPQGLLSFEALAGISPWLMKRIEAARKSEVHVDGREVMTKATREALLSAFASLGERSAELSDSRSGRRAPAPSFLDRFLNWPARGTAA